MTVTSAASDPYAYLDSPYEGASLESRYQPASGKTEEGAKGVEKKDMALFGEDGFGFDDFLDIINPLQHIPVISNLYRKFTGDELSPGARMIGGGIFGGGIGLASSVLNTAIEAETGKDIGGHVIGFLTGEETPQSNNTTIADAEKATQTVPENKTAQSPVAEAAPSAAAQQAGAVVLTPASVQATAKPTATDQAGNNLPLGLKWKGAGPDISRKLDQIQTSNNQNFSEAQMQHILNAFGNQNKAPENTAAPNPATGSPQQAPIADAVKTYEKNAAEKSALQKTVSQSSFDYLDQMI